MIIALFNLHTIRAPFDTYTSSIQAVPVQLKLTEMKSLKTRFSYMAIALFIAYRALEMGETPVACIFVDELSGKVLSFGCNNTNESLNGTRHAEMEAIDKIMKEYGLYNTSPAECTSFFAKLTVYVTIEPCVMCALALEQVGVKKVYFGAANERFGGNGTVIKAQDDSSYVSIGGIMRVEAIHLLRSFYIQENDSAPVPKVKKNKEIVGKKFPPNLKFLLYMSPAVFILEFGEKRLNVFYSDLEVEKEITPQLNEGYVFEDIIVRDSLSELPDLGVMYHDQQVAIEEDIRSLSQLLPAIDDEGTAYFRSPSESKKRKLAAEV